MINWDNYEEYLILHADGELDEAGETALAKFIEQHPEVATELEGYEAVHLEPDMAMTYGDKTALLKPEIPVSPAVGIGGRWQRYILAGALILTVAGGAIWALNNKEEVKTANSITAVKQAPAAQTLKSVTPAPVQPIVKTNEQAIPTTNTVATANITINQPITKVITTNSKTAPVIKQDAMETIEVIPAYNLNEEARVELTKKVALPPQPIVKPYMDAKPQSSFIDKLPINEDRREGLENLKENITETIDKAKDIRNEIKDAQFSLKLGNKELRLF